MWKTNNTQSEKKNTLSKYMLIESTAAIRRVEMRCGVCAYNLYMSFACDGKTLAVEFNIADVMKTHT